MSGSPSNPYAPQSQEPPQLPQSSAGSADLTAADWVLCVLCSGIACIIGIIRLIQGKPSGGKMVGIAIAFMVLWGLVRVGIELLILNAP